MAKYKQRKDGRYSTQVRTGKYDKTGHPIKVTLYAKSSAALEKLVAETRYEIDKSIYVKSSNMRFGDYAQEWVQVAKANRGIKTREMYEGIVKNHIDILYCIPLKSVTKSDIQKQINAVSDHPRTCQQMRITINQILQSAVDDNLILSNPCKNIELPRRVKHERRAFTKAESTAIKEAEYPDKECMVYVLTLFYTGMRPAEAFALTIRDIDTVNNTITINKSLTFSRDGVPHVVYPKTNDSIRTIQVKPELIELIKGYAKEHKALGLFTDADGKYRKRWQYDTLWDHAYKAIVAALGHPTEITPYYFRHNWITAAYYSGLSLLAVEKMVGHSSHEMILAIYAHLDAEKEMIKNKIESMVL